MRAVSTKGVNKEGIVFLVVENSSHSTTLRVRHAEGGLVGIESPFGVWAVKATDIADIADALVGLAGRLRRLA